MQYVYILWFGTIIDKGNMNKMKDSVLVEFLETTKETEVSEQNNSNL